MLALPKPIQFTVGAKLPLLDITRQLFDTYAYETVHGVTASGQMRRQGGDLLIWPVNLSEAIRLEWFGDKLEHIVGQNTHTKYEVVDIEPNLFMLDGQVTKPEEVVVHWGHGIGRFRARMLKRVENEDRPYIALEYADNANLYVPLNRTDLLSRYMGVGKAPKLSKLGSGAWQRVRARVEQSVFELAKELLLIYAKRELKKVAPLKWPAKLEKDLEASFPYSLTADQITALGAALSDLKKRRPMDRLIAGDVGFGKTEVAIRVAAAAAMGGQQVAVLAPTTILVEQHQATFEQRLSSLPLNIRRLSRFASSGEVAEVLIGLKEGAIDIVIGTHRLLGEDVRFKRLGLVVIDEEQKFGVRHKERLKQLRLDAHILSLSATPIPRTLFMALSGIRDLSLIQTPPQNRLPIATEVAEMGNAKVVEYITRELERGGQVYLLHNDVRTMPVRLKELQGLLPGVTIEMAHGQMPEEKLGTVMHNFTSGQIQVLLCSTIIESGLDLPNANTLIVEKAENFGLADLYQLRGRIGRSNRQAYALLMFSKHSFHGAARERLTALSEMTELGKGYEVALKDLDIRGGGNVLGKEQHGNMEAIGLILYTKLLNQAVDRLKQRG